MASTLALLRSGRVAIRFLFCFWKNSPVSLYFFTINLAVDSLILRLDELLLIDFFLFITKSTSCYRLYFMSRNTFKDILAYFLALWDRDYCGIEIIIINVQIRSLCIREVKSRHLRFIFEEIHVFLHFSKLNCHFWWISSCFA